MPQCRKSHVAAHFPFQDEKDKQHLISKLSQYTNEFDSNVSEPVKKPLIQNNKTAYNQVNQITVVPEKKQPPSGTIVEVL